MSMYSVLIWISSLRHLKTYQYVVCSNLNFFTEAFENIWVCIMYSSEFLHWGIWKHMSMYSVLIWISSLRHLQTYEYVVCSHLNFYTEAFENIWVCILYSSEFLHWSTWKHMSMLSVLIWISSLKHLKTCEHVVCTHLNYFIEALENMLIFFFCAHQKYRSKELENICCMYLSSEVPQWVHFDDNSLLIQFGWKIKHFILI